MKKIMRMEFFTPTYYGIAFGGAVYEFEIINCGAVSFILDPGERSMSSSYDYIPCSFSAILPRCLLKNSCRTLPRGFIAEDRCRKSTLETLIYKRKSRSFHE